MAVLYHQRAALHLPAKRDAISQCCCQSVRLVCVCDSVLYIASILAALATRFVHSTQPAKCKVQAFTSCDASGRCASRRLSESERHLAGEPARSSEGLRRSEGRGAIDRALPGAL